MMITRRNSIAHDLVYVIGIMVALVVSAVPVYGQFIVQPMMFELAVSPGQRYLHKLELHNHDTNIAMMVKMAVVDLSQWEDSSWRIVDPNSDDVDASKLNSCKNWMSLSHETLLVEPLSIVAIDLTFKVPPGIYGFYSAGIVVSVMRAGEEREVAIVLQFVVPVLVRIPGRVVRHKVELTDVGMGFREANEANPATTLVSLTVANNGGTYSRLIGRLRVWGFFEDHWRRITEREIRGLSILPGSELKLERDIERSLPPGRYRVWGGLYVDGQRAKPFEKEIDFAGDPTATKVSTDAALDLMPREVVIESLPGATRTAVLQVINASDEEVNIRVKKALPPELMGVAAGPLKGEFLDCTSWLDIMPKEFKLSSYGQYNVRIIAKMPSPEAMFPCYYGLIGLFATYPDGQNAGITTANICIVNNKINAPLDAQSSGVVRLASQTESNYLVTCGFTNYGYIHFAPKRCIAKVTNVSVEGALMAQAVLSGERGLMLPLETRIFSGLLDFSDFPIGFYRVEVNLEYGISDPPAIATNQIGIKVDAKGAKRIIETVGRDVFEQIGVKW